MTHTLHEAEHTTDEYISDATRAHREWRDARDRRVIEAVDCPRCKSVAGIPCIGTMDDERHAGEELPWPHIERHTAAGRLPAEV
jgi:hypothetical protein